MINASALAGRLAAAYMPCGPEAHRHPSGYAEAGPFLSPLPVAAMPGTSRRHDAGLGSMGIGATMRFTEGRVAVWMAGDLSPKDWNHPDSRTARAADLETN